MNPNTNLSTPNTDFVLYTDNNGCVQLKVHLQEESLWLTQKMMAELFDVEVHTINYHLKEIFKSSELLENSVIRKFRITASDGKKYTTNFYNLDAIIAVGYRVNSKRATQFRIWATQILRDYIIKGFVMNDERLKQGERSFKKDYFSELLERVRSIRTSERRIYFQITDIFSECCTDYDPDSQTTQNFYAFIQNKFHYAITGQTAAEIIHTKANHTTPNMGLTTWKNAPKGRVLASDVTIAKNYLDEKQIKRLERTVSGFFDYIENRIENQHSFTMQEFAMSVDKFLNFHEYKVLENKGHISKKQAEDKALNEYNTYNKTQKIHSDFENELQKILSGTKDTP